MKRFVEGADRQRCDEPQHPLLTLVSPLPIPGAGNDISLGAIPALRSCNLIGTRSLRSVSSMKELAGACL